MTNFTKDWSPLGEFYYRKHELYEMQWPKNINLSKCLVAAAQFAGPIALMLDDRKVDRPSGSNVRPIVYLYSSSGKQLASFEWKSGRLIGLGWTCTEDLVCIQDDGRVLLHDLSGTFKRYFEMGPEASEVKVLEAQVFNSYNGTGVALITNLHRFWVVNNVEDPHLRQLGAIPAAAAPSVWVMLTRNRQSQVLAAVGTKVYLLDHGGQCTEETVRGLETIQFRQILSLSVSYNNKFLALFTDTGHLWLGSSDLQTCLCVFDTKCPMKPVQLIWCGAKTVVAYWDEILLVVNPQKFFIKYSYFDYILLIPEMDGVRVLSSSKMELLQKVPDAVDCVLKMGSMEEGAMLFEAYQEYKNCSPRARDFLKTIQDLALAVDQCTQAAGHEWEPVIQKDLLRAATFGKSFLPTYKPEPFVDVCQKLRVLNALRDAWIGIPLTYVQLDHLSMAVVIDRLVLRKQFGLAVEICKFLRLPESEGASRILAHWACYKVDQTDVDDDSIAVAISSRLGETPGVSYADIANRAIEKGRTKLAIRLLEYEPQASRQVPLLMKLKKMPLALTKAIDSGDTDLVHTVLKKLRDDLSQGDFFLSIRTQPVAYALYQNLCRQQNRKKLQLLFEQEDNHSELGVCRIWDSYEQELTEGRLSALASAQDSFRKAHNDWAAKQTEDEVRLIRFQRKLELDYNRPYLDLSLHQTLHQLIQENNQRMVEQLRKDFKISEKRFWWVKVHALAEVSDWIELDKFSKTKKSPIGFEPFVDVSLKSGNKVEAEKYLLRVSPERKSRCLLKMGCLQDAADAAFVCKDMEGLVNVQQKCSGSDRVLLEKIEEYKAKLRNN